MMIQEEDKCRWLSLKEVTCQKGIEILKGMNFKVSSVSVEYFGNCLKKGKCKHYEKEESKDGSQ